MAIQFSLAVRNARLDSVESTTGTSALMRLFTGSPPANCAAADSGTLLAELSLPTDWMAAASGGSKSLAGTWEDLSANGSGTFGHFRVYNTAGSTCHIQGTAGTSGTDMIVSAATVTAGDSFTVTSFTLTDGNA